MEGWGIGDKSAEVAEGRRKRAEASGGRRPADVGAGRRGRTRSAKADGRFRLQSLAAGAGKAPPLR